MSKSSIGFFLIVCICCRSYLCAIGESCQGARVRNGTNQTIIDSHSVEWGIDENNTITRNGQEDNTTSDVLLLVYRNQIVYQQNRQYYWWKWVNYQWVPERNGFLILFLVFGSGCSSPTRPTSRTSTLSTPRGGTTARPVPFAPLVCTSNYVGDSCDIPMTACTAEPCQNNGTCTDNSGPVYGYSCSCPPNFSGTNCEYYTGLCQADTCLYNNTCLQVNATSFFCNCTGGHTGIHCEHQINYCGNVTCVNRGVCRPLLLDYQCECPTGFSGRYCEEVATSIVVRQYVSKSFAYVGIVAIVITICFVLLLDVLKYVCGMDVARKEVDTIKRKKGVKASVKRDRQDVNEGLYVRGMIKIALLPLSSKAKRNKYFSFTK